MSGWPGVVITLWHCWPRSKGARVTVHHHERHIVSSASSEGMTVNDPNIHEFLTWAREYYAGAAERKVTETAP